MRCVMQVYNEMFTDASPERTERMFHYLDPDNTGYVDYLGWSQSIKLQVLCAPLLSQSKICLHFNLSMSFCRLSSSSNFMQRLLPVCYEHEMLQNVCSAQ